MPSGEPAQIFLKVVLDLQPVDLLLSLDRLYRCYRLALPTDVSSPSHTLLHSLKGTLNHP